MSHTEEFEISGDKLVAKVKEIIAAGNVRRITIKNEEGKSLLEIPLNVGVVAALVAPVLAAVGGVAALLTKCVIAVERQERPEAE
jgi:integral membrane sensor domain MASE1